MTASAQPAAQEWKTYWTLPAAAALGYATSVIHIYGLSPYITPLEEAFGWSRAQVTVGLTIATVINGIFAVPIGIMVDRLGPRLVGIAGVILTTSAFAFMSTATGSSGNWWLLWMLIAFATLPVQATVWTSAVASRFEVSRGLALAITLSGASLAATVFPPLASYLIENFGWRTAFVGQAGTWAAITLPMLVFFFRGAKDDTTKAPEGSVATQPLPGVDARVAMRTTIFLRLFVACLLFTFTIIALVVHFIPILMGYGVDRLAAAGAASLIGVFSIVGRLGTGLLLDRFPGSYVGAAAFLLPILACLLLMTAGSVPAAQLLAAAVIGLTLGSEVDVVAYLTTRHFGLRNFGTIYGGLLLALSLGTAFGPLAAASVFDLDGSYTSFLFLTILFMAISSIALASLPHPGFSGERKEEVIFPSVDPTS
mgnify:CR=1 FL=1